MNYPAVLRLLGQLLRLLGLAELVPIVCSLWYGETYSAWSFAFSAGLTLLVGQLLTRVRVPSEHLYRREGILVVVAGWFLASIFGAVPFVVSGAIPAPVDALFEAASGFTTTGSSILTDIESLPKGVLFWRCQTQWLGGLGIIVLFVALLSGIGPGARYLYQVEVPGPTKEVLHPRVKSTAVVLLEIYLVLTVAQVSALLLAGVSFYNALTHTFATLSTGGFSPLNQSVAGFHSTAVELIIIFFMLVAGINFSLLYTVVVGRARLWQDREFLVYISLTLAVTALVYADLRANGLVPGRDALVDSAFQVVSLLTTTGFATADFNQWPDASKALLLMVMIVGGSAGSTAGGVKVMRALIALKTALREVRLNFSPNAVVPVTVRGSLVPEEVTRSVAGFVVLFGATLVFGSAALTLGGHDLITSGSAALACLSNIGPGLAGVGPTNNFAFFGPLEKLLLVLLMWLGRLEVLAIIALTTKRFWTR